MGANEIHSLAGGPGLSDSTPAKTLVPQIRLTRQQLLTDNDSMELVPNREPDVVAANSQLARRRKLDHPDEKARSALISVMGRYGRTLYIKPGS
jgi:hypothetical protein